MLGIAGSSHSTVHRPGRPDEAAAPSRAALRGNTPHTSLLAHHPSDELVRRLRGDEDPDLRAEAALALDLVASPGAEVVVALEDALDDPDPVVQVFAAYTLLRGSAAPSARATSRLQREIREAGPLQVQFLLEGVRALSPPG